MPNEMLAQEGDVKGMYELYERGATLAEVGRHHGVSANRVGYLFKRAGLRKRPRGARRQTNPGTAASSMAARTRKLERVREMHLLYEQGRTLKQVGGAFGVTGGRVSQLFKEVGLPARPHTSSRR